MKYFIETLLLLSLFFISACMKSGTKLSISDILDYSDRIMLPTQEEYPDEGAVILFEKEHIDFKLDGSWNPEIKRRYHLAMVYFNDKAENLLTNLIYLGDDRILLDFYARTIHPDGKISELSNEDLFQTKISDELYEFSNEKSVKFTFPAVEPGAVLEYYCEVKITNRNYNGDTWYIQGDIPKLYTAYSVEIPDIYPRYGYNWNFLPVNFELGLPLSQENIANQNSEKDRSHIYSWEVRDISSLSSEPNMPPYRDVAKYVRIGFQYKKWNELSESYWKDISDKFDPDLYPEVVQLAQNLVKKDDDEESKIRKIYEYTQQEYRYIFVNVNESGYIPHTADKILKKKYGDCKDMSVMNVVMLKALGIDAKPVLVNTKNRGQTLTDLVSLDFNHMITYVKSKDGKVYWLDSTGSSCPLGEVYSSLEGALALVLRDDGSSFFTKIPLSKSKENCLSRNVNINIAEDGNAKGHVSLIFTGNENISIRSKLKDGSENDMKKSILRYANANTPGLEIDNLVYDNPHDISNKFRLEFDFEKSQLANDIGGMLIMKPDIFVIESYLHVYSSEEREFDIRYNSPWEVIDKIEIRFNHNVLAVKAIPKRTTCKYSFGKLVSFATSLEDGVIDYQRRFKITSTSISSSQYNDFRELLKRTAAVSGENIVLNKK